MSRLMNRGTPVRGNASSPSSPSPGSAHSNVHHGIDPSLPPPADTQRAAFPL
jgi:hypothetical protein